MVKLVIYLEFKRDYEGKERTHSGNHTFRGTSKRFCYWLCDQTIEDMEGWGWKLIERRLVEYNVH